MYDFSLENRMYSTSCSIYALPVVVERRFNLSQNENVEKSTITKNTINSSSRRATSAEQNHQKVKTLCTKSNEKREKRRRRINWCTILCENIMISAALIFVFFRSSSLPSLRYIHKQKAICSFHRFTAALIQRLTTDADRINIRKRPIFHMFTHLHSQFQPLFPPLSTLCIADTDLLMRL